MKNKILMVLMLLVSATSSMAQNSNDYSDESVFFRLEPSAPSASSLGRYGTHQVVLNNGLTPINITLYEIQCGDLKVPIQLCYHGGGIKVEQEATWVGLGWDLDFGGSIVRTVNGSEDKLEKLDSVPSASYIASNILYDNSNYQYCYDLATGRDNRTFQPDLYSFKIGSNSGTFYTKGRMGTAGYEVDSIFTTSCQKIKIANSHFFNTGLIMDDGVLYKFNQTETTTITTPRRYIPPYISAYYVTHIISPTGKDTIRYTYQDSGWSRISHSQCYTGFEHIEKTFITQWPDRNGTRTTYSNNRVSKTFTDYYIPEVQTVKPQYIYFRGGCLKFNLQDREDGLYANSQKLKKLSSIEVQERADDGQYQTIKIIEFHYSYFNNGTNNEYGKLRLDSIMEKNTPNLNDETKLIASFSYYGQNANLPAHNSYSKDFWGFYNGRINTSEIPYMVLTGSNGPELVSDADRTPDEQYMKYGSLRSVTYPTGGRTEYDWEINRINLPAPLYGEMKTCSLTYRPQHMHKEGPTPFEGDSTITIHSYKDQYVQISITITKDTLYKDEHNKLDHCRVYLDEKELAAYTGNNHTFHTTATRLFSQGDHTIYIQCNCKNMSGSFSLKYWGRDGIENNNVPFTGLRICKITDFDSNDSILTCRKYDYTAPNGQSSGYLLTDDGNKDIDFFLSSVSVAELLEGNSTYLYKVNRNVVFSDMKRGPRENDYAYEYVTEHLMNGNTILSSTVYKYDKHKDSYVSAYTPLGDMSCYRNNIVLKEEFSYQNNQQQLWRRTENYYHKDDRITSNATGFVLHTNHVFSSPGVFVDYSRCYGVDLHHIYVPYNYTVDCNWVHLDSTIVKEYCHNNTNDSIIRKTLYSYNSPVHLQPTQISQIAGNDKYITTMTYPSDMTGSLYTSMVAQNMLTYPVDRREYSVVNGASMVLCGGLHHQYAYDNTLLTLSQVSRILPNNSTERLYDYTYNDCGRLVDFVDKDHVMTSIKWDANNVRPLYVAKGVSHTVLNALSNLSSPTANPTVPISCYTYQPLVGMTSWKTPFGMETRYVYDSLERLYREYMYKPDNSQQLIREYEYNYAH